MLTHAELNTLWNASNPGSCGDIVTFAQKVIEANNAKVLADLKPIGYIDRADYRCLMVGHIIASIRAHSPLADDVQIYSAETVSALIQRNEALEARVKELEDECARWVSLLPNPNKMPTRHFDKLPESFTPDEIGKALGVADRPKATTEQRDTYWKQLERSGER